MSGAMHTERPWGVETTDTSHWIGPMRPDGVKVDEVVAHLDHGPDYTPEYNARAEARAYLIAAGPIMWEALLAIHDREWADGDIVAGHRHAAEMWRIADEAIAAIAKAKGLGA